MMAQTLCLTFLCGIFHISPDLEVAETSREKMTSEMEETVNHECQALNAEGQIENILAELRKDAKLVISRSENTDLESLQNRIHDNVNKAQTILVPAWTESKWPFHAIWSVGHESPHPFDLSHLKLNFEIVGVEIQSVLLAGINRDDLISSFTISTHGSAAQIHFSQVASTLDLCQLEETILIKAQVQYAYQALKFTKSLELRLQPGARPHFVPEIPGLARSTYQGKPIPLPPIDSDFKPWRDE